MAARTPRLSPRRASAKIGQAAVQLSRPPMERMVRLRQMIGVEKFPSSRKMAATLEVSSKTVQRDIEFMRDRLGYPIAYSEKEFGYYFTEKMTSFPMMEISEGEVAALFIAQMALEQHRGTVFEKPLRTACEKIVSSMPGKITVNWAEMDAAVSFRSVGVSGAEMGVFEAVSRAVLQSVEIAFHYHKLGSEQMELRRAQPYHLGCVNNQWYCFAHDLDRGAIRQFALPRMRSVKLSRTKFQRPEDFSIQRHLAGSFGVFCGDGDGKVRKVRVRFDAWAARLVGERAWHESQAIKALAGGGIELSLELGSLEEVERWILSWGEHAEVVSPKALRQRIQKIAGAIAARNA